MIIELTRDSYRKTCSDFNLVIAEWIDFQFRICSSAFVAPREEAKVGIGAHICSETKNLIDTNLVFLPRTRRLGRNDVNTDSGCDATTRRKASSPNSSFDSVFNELSHASSERNGGLFSRLIS